MVKIIKLANGTEIIGEVVTMSSTIVILKTPLQINYKYHLSSYPSVSLSKYLMFADGDEISFQCSDIINIVTPIEKFIFYYQKIVEIIKTEFDTTIDRELGNLLDIQTTSHSRERNDHDNKLLKSFLESYEFDGLKN